MRVALEYQDNEELLRKIRDGKIPNSHIKTAIGSFIMCIFEKDMMPDVIPLFFSFSLDNLILPWGQHQH